MAATPVIYTGKGIKLAQPEYITYRSEQATELTFAQMDTNFSKVTTVNFAVDNVKGNNVSIQVFDDTFDTSKFDVAAPFALISANAEIFDIGKETSNGYSYLDSDGIPEGGYSQFACAYLLTYDPKSNSIKAKDIVGELTASLSVTYENDQITISGLRAKTVVIEGIINITWIQPKPEGVIFNPRLNPVIPISQSNQVKEA